MLKESTMDVVILAGGMGTRMGSELPKAMVSVSGKPIISWQIDRLKHMDGKIILSLGHMSEKVIDHVRENYDDSIIFSIEDEPLGTGGALRLAIGKASSDFVLVLNCDDITDISLDRIKGIRENSIFVCNPTLPFGLVKEKDGYAVFEEKPKLSEWVSCGWYVLGREELMKILPEKGSLEYDVFPRIRLRVEKHEGRWFPLNTKKDLLEFEEYVQSSGPI
jgi:mannose-1-phosphate guanylyltransferase